MDNRRAVFWLLFLGGAAVVALIPEYFFAPEEEALLPEPAACLHCGRCHRVCPMHLQPYAIEDAFLSRDAGRAARFGAQHCVECGACGYICPARRHLVQDIRLAKALVRGSAAARKP